LLTFARQRNLPLFALRWESKDTAQLEEILKGNADKTGLSSLYNQSWSEILKLQNINNLASFANQTFSGWQEVFNEARMNAKRTGKYLGQYLSTLPPHLSVTLVGFSLGSQVTKSCLNTLFKCGRHDLVHNVVFLAGATFTTEKGLKK
jgi:pimeloyl-ACP methyl ester carboxylesterase